MLTVFYKSSSFYGACFFFCFLMSEKLKNFLVSAHKMKSCYLEFHAVDILDNSFLCFLIHIFLWISNHVNLEA